MVDFSQADLIKLTDDLCGTFRTDNEKKRQERQQILIDIAELTDALRSVMIGYTITMQAHWATKGKYHNSLVERWKWTEELIARMQGFEPPVVN